jgi:hypothetical protein
VGRPADAGRPNRASVRLSREAPVGVGEVRSKTGFWSSRRRTEDVVASQITVGYPTPDTCSRAGRSRPAVRQAHPQRGSAISQGRKATPGRRATSRRESRQADDPDRRWMNQWRLPATATEPGTMRRRESRDGKFHGALIPTSRSVDTTFGSLAPVALMKRKAWTPKPLLLLAREIIAKGKVGAEVGGQRCPPPRSGLCHGSSERFRVGIAGSRGSLRPHVRTSRTRLAHEQLRWARDARACL